MSERMASTVSTEREAFFCSMMVAEYTTKNIKYLQPAVTLFARVSL